MEVDLQNFVERKLSTILHNVLKEWNQKWNYITELDTMNEFYGEIIGRLWEKSLAYYKGFFPANQPCSAEEEVAAIIHRGLKKKSVEYCDGFFYLSMPNHTYVIKKCEKVFQARPLYGRFAYQDYSSKWILMKKEAFADFLLEFDALLSSVKSRIEESVSSRMPQIESQCRIADEIKHLTEEFLKEEGIRCKIEGFERKGNIRLTFFKDGILPLHKVVCPADLRDYFQKVPALMEKRPMWDGYSIFGRDSGTVTAFLDWNLVPKEERMRLIDFFTKDDSHTHSRIKNLNREFTEDGLTKIHFFFSCLDWVHLFWDIEHSFPHLNAVYMVVPSRRRLASFDPYTLYTNDAEGKFFKVEDSPVKVISDLHEIRQDCEVDKTTEMGRSIRNDLEFCFPFEDDEDGDDMCLDS